MTRILLDATNTARTQYNTGIERVVRRVAECSQAIQHELDVPCIPVICRQGRIVTALPVAGVTKWDDRLARVINNTSATATRVIAQGVKTVLPTGAQVVAHTASRLRKALYPRTAVRAASNAYAFARGRSIRLQPDDIILLLDACWSTPPDLYELGSQQGCFLAQVVYDILPLTHRQFFLPQMHDAFKKWVDYALNHVDCFWAISRTVRNELLAYSRGCDAQQHAAEADRTAGIPDECFRVFRLALT